MEMTTKERIIETSTELFNTKGIRSITMDEISSVNGISKRTLYELFADKSTLIEACFMSLANKMREISMELRREASNILEYILIYQDYESRESEKRSRVLTDEMRKFYPDVYKKAIEGVKKEHISYTKSLIEEGINEGLFEPKIGSIDVATQILTLLVSINSFAVSDSIRKNSTHQEIFMSSVVIFLRGLSTDKGREVIDNYFKNRNIL
jgi:AcrR family transcriptional regulator